MRYTFIEDFKYGIDRRRPRFAGIPGTLWDCENGVLSRGGDIERTKRFVPEFTGLENTYGLANIGNRVFVFGSQDLAALMPAGVEYQRLEAPGAPEMVGVLDVERFDRKLYVIAEYADGNRYHFYNGVRVSDWDTVADSIASADLTYDVLSDILSANGQVEATPYEEGVLVRALSPGTPFILIASIADGGGTIDEGAIIIAEQPNVVGTPAVDATAGFDITGGSFDPNVSTVSSVKVGPDPDLAIELLAGPVSWISDNTATANAVAVAINDRTPEHGYSAAPLGDSVVVSSIPGFGVAGNAYTLYVSTSGDVTTTGDAAFTGGADAVEAQAQIDRIQFTGTFEPLDTITVTLDGVTSNLTGRAAATGSQAHVAYSRVFSIAGPAAAYCGLNDPLDWTSSTPAATDPGIFVVATDSDGAQRLTGVEDYQQFTAFFADSAVVIYDLGTDPDTFDNIQDLENTGTIAGGSVIQYGATDLFYLDSTGIRSLQARDSSNAAFVSDAGTTFDPYVQERVANRTSGQIRRSKSVIEPKTGAYWFALEDEIFILSNFQGTGIRGWTRAAPGFVVTDMVRTVDRVILRSADTIYFYGGRTGNEYPLKGETPVKVSLPFMTARDAAGFKSLLGFDIGATNEWLVEALVNPNDETEKVIVGRYVGVTYSKENSEQVGETTHVAYEMTCSQAGFASLSSLAAGHEGELRA